MPLTLVKQAVERSRDDEVDDCWCVFDVESPKPHPHLAEALVLARDHSIRLAVSNPCFELWLLLHLENHSAFMSTAEAERRSRALDGRAGKRIDPSDYMPHRRIAAGRAEFLRDRHERNGTRFPDDNPSSTVYELLAAIEP